MVAGPSGGLLGAVDRRCGEQRPAVGGRVIGESPWGLAAAPDDEAVAGPESGRVPEAERRGGPSAPAVGCGVVGKGRARIGPGADNDQLVAVPSGCAAETDAGAVTPAETLTSSLDSDYEIRLATDDLISIAFSESAYERGAAHPNSNTSVLNYDIRNRKKLALADLFNAKSNYLKAISDYCIKDLKQQAKKDKDSMLSGDMIQSGAAARADNFNAWTITKQGLWITFDPYQVAAYAAGPQKVLIPYPALKDLIKVDGPIAAFLQ